jgi:hypothetical protein
MIPGEIAYGDGDVVINEGAQRLELSVMCTSRRPMRRWTSTGPPPTGTGWTSRLAPRCVSNPVSLSRFPWSRWVGHARYTV